MIASIGFNQASNVYHSLERLCEEKCPNTRDYIKIFNASHVTSNDSLPKVKSPRFHFEYQRNTRQLGS